jgi:hypothetical protein
MGRPTASNEPGHGSPAASHPRPVGESCAGHGGACHRHKTGIVPTPWPKYSEAVIWGNSRCFPIQVTLPKALFFGKVSSDKMRQNNELFLDTSLVSAIIFGNVFTAQYLP